LIVGLSQNFSNIISVIQQNFKNTINIIINSKGYILDQIYSIISIEILIKLEVEKLKVTGNIIKSLVVIRVQQISPLKQPATLLFFTFILLSQPAFSHVILSEKI
jgi:hypothetical protein